MTIVLGHTASSTTGYDRNTLGNIALIFLVYTGEEAPLSDGCIEPSKPPSELRQEPYPLPKDFVWSTVDIKNDEEVGRISRVRRSWKTG